MTWVIFIDVFAFLFHLKYFQVPFFGHMVYFEVYFFLTTHLEFSRYSCFPRFSCGIINGFISFGVVQVCFMAWNMIYLVDCFMCI